MINTEDTEGRHTEDTEQKEGGKRMELEVDEREKRLDPLTGKVIACAIEVHRTLGPGLLEAT